MEKRPTARTLQKGENAIIQEIKKNEFSSRLLSLGIIPGKKCSIAGWAPFGGAGILALDNHQIALRDVELDSIYIHHTKAGGL
ncbi:MAG: ferrous iron transport protein A [Saprospiraceae bacterium]|nr:ferrous iron transport protein A [Saprospiraceae bacterium]MBK6564779.1 ferrous iron transport protein A [Saprospiraceae bacterium]MBK7523423.1 ferrous iron transport protein A [Saprospiraceae bacterium]MBK8079520.1 ferrous iron transport protein A [Saprospiraceae bacterium]MBK8371588.1 ferrous iron transport protein A [Saprospiraceae bacterium]